jgi:hypothetical protein
MALEDYHHRQHHHPHPARFAPLPIDQSSASYYEAGGSMAGNTPVTRE